jgi:hypothetical protein
MCAEEAPPQQLNIVTNLWAGENVLVSVVVVWFLSMTLRDCMRHSRLGPCSNNYMKWWTSPHTAWIWHTAIVICFLPWRSTCENIVSLMMKMSDILKSHVWCNRLGCYVYPGWTNLITCCDKCLDLQEDYAERYCTSDTLILYCQFSLLKCCLWFMCAVIVLSDSLSYVCQNFHSFFTFPLLCHHNLGIYSSFSLCSLQFLPL